MTRIHHKPASTPPAAAAHAKATVVPTAVAKKGVAPLTLVRGAAPGLAPLDLSGAPAAALAHMATNPFADIAGAGVSMAPMPPLLAEHVPMSRDLAPPAHALASLVGLQRSVMAKEPGVAAKTRDGFMLVLADAVPVQVTASRVPRDVTTAVSQRLVEIKQDTAKSEAKLTAHVQHVAASMKSQFPLGMDVHAFVQAVLRESYLLQTETLRDFAERVQAENNRRKAIREKLYQVRTMLAGGKAPADFQWDSFDKAGFTPVAPKGAADSEAGSTDAPNATAPSFSAELASCFALVPPPSELGGILGALADDLRKETTWDGRWARIYEKFNLSGRTPVAEALHDVAHLSERDFVYLVETLTLHKEGELLGTIMEHCTAEQISWLESWWGASRLAEVERLAGCDLDLKKDERASRTQDLPSSVTSDPRLEGVVAIYDEWRSRPEQGDLHLTRLCNAMWALPPDAACNFLEALQADMDRRGVSEGVFDAVFFACQGRALFEYASPDEWSFLARAGGKAQRFFERWTNTGPAHRASADPIAQVRAGVSIGLSVSGSERAALLGGVSATVSGVQSSERSPTETSDAAGSATASTAPDAAQHVNEDNLKLYEEYLKNALQTSEGDAQLMNMDLQEALQRQQQAIQMMSNISKLLHDVAMGIIRNIGA